MTVIDDYLQKVEPAQREALERVRRICMEVVPDAEDTIGYGMPVLKYKGKYLIGFCQFKNHMSVFPGAGALETMHAKLDGYITSKGTIQFTLEKPLSEAIITEMIKLRYDDIVKG